MSDTCGGCRFARTLPDPGPAPTPTPAPTTFWGKALGHQAQRHGMDDWRISLWEAMRADAQVYIRCHRFPAPNPLKRKAGVCGEFAAIEQ